ncbi:MAG: pentapeptide repeat-containing protein [Synechococcales cyanobacterium RU_4_20]|nr:pentapeptide repeat-containing protein [Synechococcales cyanobacterium RU_4_20]
MARPMPAARRTWWPICWQGDRPKLCASSSNPWPLRILRSGRGELRLTPGADTLSFGEIPLPSLYFQVCPIASVQPEQIQPNSASTTLRLSFTSSTLGSYQCAEAIAAALQTITQRVQTHYGEAFSLETPEALAQHLYQLLGHSPLSPRLVSFILERLRREQQRESPGVSFRVLSDRLHEFYRDYCQGRWLDEGFPQRAYKTFRSLDNPFNTLQVDAAVGLNVFTLLCALAQETEVPFWPCGNPNNTLEYNPNRLLQLMGRTAILSPLAFWVYARRQLGRLHLNKARLSQLMLAGADLRRIQCREASLMGSNLEGCDLGDANLSGSNLQRVNLRQSRLIRTNLQGADLRYADLTGAQLEGVNLCNACVAHAHLDVATSAIAQQSGAFFSVTEYQVYQQLARTDVDEESYSEEDDTFSGTQPNPSQSGGQRQSGGQGRSSARNRLTSTLGETGPSETSGLTSGLTSRATAGGVTTAEITTIAPPRSPEFNETQSLETQALETQASESPGSHHPSQSTGLTFDAMAAEDETIAL